MSDTVFWLIFGVVTVAGLGFIVRGGVGAIWSLGLAGWVVLQLVGAVLQLVGWASQELASLCLDSGRYLSVVPRPVLPGRPTVQSTRAKP